LKRVAIVCPGRGSYTERELGSLPKEHAWVARADELRAGYGLPALAELDQAERFSAALHLRPANAAPLIWLATHIDVARALEDLGVQAACVLGNSMGWYTALAVAGSLDFDDGFRLVQEMALLQEEAPGGGQVLYPLVGEDWRPDPWRERAVEAALAAAAGAAWPSIHLGGYAVLAGSDAGLASLLRSLPPVELGKSRYPFKLVGHGPYHTPLLARVSERARATLAKLRWRRPVIALIDGRGRRFTPWSADPTELADYTLGAQVVTPYDFSLCVRVALREYAPDELCLPGPGNSLGGACGQILVRERWRGIDSRAAFDAEQQGAGAPVRSLRRASG
jgi:acyl transferase domain-containing protein